MEKQNERYHDVSFEEEVIIMIQIGLSFNRKHYAWFKYIKLRSYKKWKKIKSMGVCGGQGALFF